MVGVEFGGNLQASEYAEVTSCRPGSMRKQSIAFVHLNALSVHHDDRSVVLLNAVYVM